MFVAAGFGPGGEHWEVICPTVTETVLKGEINSRLADGRRKTGTWQITKKSDDEMPVLFEGTVDGKQVTINASFKRVKEGAQAKLAPEFVKSSDYFVGTWNAEFAAEGRVYRGRWAADWSTDKTCVISSWEGAESMGSPRGTRVQGWDPVAKQILLIEFGSDGSWSIERYTIVSDEVDEGTITGVDAEGKPYEATVRTVKKDPDCFTWSVTRDGVPQENTFRRVR